MTYQSYPSIASLGQMHVAPQPQPPSLRNAVWLMCLGAGVALLGTITAVLRSSSIKAEIFNRVHANNHRIHAGYTIAQLHTIASITFVALVVAGLISMLLWLWMAWANHRASGWARICASVLFAFMTLEVAFARSEANVPLASVVFIVLEWVVGLGAVILLWRRATTAYIGPG
jgi:hypothetical protein